MRMLQQRTVSLFVRLWVEMTRKLWDLPRSTVSLFVRLWVEISIWEHIQQILLSASSWGCELKYHEVRQKKRSPGQPLREAVSWNVNHINCFIRKKSQPLREAVSWNDICFMRRTVPSSQPLREAVSWNEPDTKVGPLSLVSLFVRLWVEIILHLKLSVESSGQPLREAVSWNNAVTSQDQKPNVSLFVRLWVEII